MPIENGSPVILLEASHRVETNIFVYLTGYGPSSCYLTKLYKMSSTLREVSHIAKFDGTNFPLWKLGLWVLLEQHNLIELVTGTSKIPSETRAADNNQVTNAPAIAE